MKDTFFLGSWTSAATKLLIAFRGSYNKKYQNKKKKVEKMELWLLISYEIKEKNHNFNANKAVL